MKPNLYFDDEIKLKSSPRWFPVRSIWLLMLLVAVSAATMTIIAGVFRHPISAKSTTGPECRLLRCRYSYLRTYHAIRS